MADAVVRSFVEDYKKVRAESAAQDFDLGEYLEQFSLDPAAYENAHGRLLKAIGEPVMIDTTKNPRQARLHGSKPLATYPAFADFHGMEDTIKDVVGYLDSGSKDAEVANKILVLIGGAGSGKSSVGDRLKSLFERQPFYAIKDSMINENPLALLDPDETVPDPLNEGQMTTVRNRLQQEYKIPPSAWPSVTSPMLARKLETAGLDELKIVKIKPSGPLQRGISKVTPNKAGEIEDSALIGQPSQAGLRLNDTDTYSFGALGFGNRGIVELAELFKAGSNNFTRLLDPTSVGTYTTPIGPLPFEGVSFAHCTPEEWKEFKDNKKNAGLLDRIVLIKFPYVLRASEEEAVYNKILKKGKRGEATIAPKTLELASKFAVLTRLAPVNTSSKDVPKVPADLLRKLDIYDGADPSELKSDAANGKSASPEYLLGLAKYRANAAADLKDDPEGMNGVSPRWMLKVLSRTFNAAGGDADPVHLFEVLETEIRKKGGEKATEYLGFVNDKLKPLYRNFLQREFQTYVMENPDFRQEAFDRYKTFADFWIQDQEYRDPKSDEVYDRAALNAELEKFEKPYGIEGAAAAKAFRDDIVGQVLRVQATGKKFLWTQHAKAKEMIEIKTSQNFDEEVWPSISFDHKDTAEKAKKHEEFVQRMVDNGGYTARQVRDLAAWIKPAVK